MGLGCKDLNLYHTKARYLSEMFGADVHLGHELYKIGRHILTRSFLRAISWEYSCSLRIIGLKEHLERDALSY